MRPSLCLFCFAIILITSGGNVRAAHAAEEAKEPLFKKPVRIRVEGVITGLTYEFMKRQIEKARAYGADLIIVDIDSPGGDAQASIDIARDLARIDWAKTVAYVDHQAMSGGAFIAIGCEEIVILKDAIIGDAGPIVQGEDSLFRHAPEKIVSFLATAVRGIAKTRNHPTAIAEAMIDKNLEVFFFRNTKTGQTSCYSDAEIADMEDGKDWERVKPVFGSGGGRFLTLHGPLAVETKLAATNVIGWEDAKKRFGITGDVPLYRETELDTFLAILNLPIVTGLLLVLGFIFLFIEIYAPGISIFGILSGCCFVLFFWSRFLGGTADWLEILLFVGGVACVAIELFLFPGVAIFGIMGFLMILGGLTMAIVPHAGDLTNQPDLILQSAATVGSSVIVFVVAAVVLARFLGDIPLFRKMLLQPPGTESTSSSDRDSEEITSSGFVAVPLLPNQEGMTRTPLRPSGKARFEGNDYDVVAEGSFIPQGKMVRVILIQGNRIVVRETTA